MEHWNEASYVDALHIDDNNLCIIQLHYINGNLLNCECDLAAFG